MTSESVVINGRTIDISSVVPLRIRDWKVLEQRGVTVEGLAAGRIAQIATVLHYVLQRADPSVTEQEIDALELSDPAVQAVLAAVGGQADRPFASSSTPSPAPTGGPSAT